MATAHTVTSASAGTAIVTGAGSIVSITVAALPNSQDMRTQLCLIDSTTGTGNLLWAADLTVLEAFLVEPRPGVSMSPGITAPTYPKTIGANIPFTTGLYVVSCPTSTTFTVTA
jgi:hypothetical protein